MRYQLIQGDCIQIMRGLPAGTVQTCVTSPPYYGLRDYGHEGQIGLEETPEAYVAKLVDVFREVRRLLKDDGTVFLNLGDSYFGSGKGPTGHNGIGDQVKRQGFDGARRGQSYGNGDKVTQGYPLSDSTSQNPCDARIDEWMSHIERTGVHPVRVRVAALYQRIQECMAELRDHLPSVDSLAQQSTWLSSPAIVDRVHSAIRVVEQLRAFLESMPAESLPPLQAGFRLLDMLSVCLTSLHSLLRCVRVYAHMLDADLKMQRDKVGSVSLFEELSHHIRCIDGYVSLVLAWLNPPQVQPYYTTGLLKPKDLIGIPWMVAFALRADGWYLRQDIIWHKPNPMPESVKDRCTKAHEYIFLLSKSSSYFYDSDAIKEASVDPQGSAKRYEAAFFVGPKHEAGGYSPNGAKHTPGMKEFNGTRNRRSVWTVTTKPYSGAHFATFPPDLIEPCILAGSKPGDTIIDPFNGSGTTGAVSLKHGRKYIGCELNPAYIELAHERIRQSQPMLLTA